MNVLPSPQLLISKLLLTLPQHEVEIRCICSRRPRWRQQWWQWWRLWQWRWRRVGNVLLGCYCCSGGSDKAEELPMRMTIRWRSAGRDTIICGMGGVGRGVERGGCLQFVIHCYHTIILCCQSRSSIDVMMLLLLLFQEHVRCWKFKFKSNSLHFSSYKFLP